MSVEKDWWDSRGRWRISKRCKGRTLEYLQAASSSNGVLTDDAL